MNLIKDLKKILHLFSYKDQQKLLLVTFIQVFLAALDLLGVAIIGIIGAVTVYGIQSKGTGDRVLTILEFLNLESMTFQRQVAYLGAFAVLIFITKTVSSVFLTRKTLFFISKRGEPPGRGALSLRPGRTRRERKAGFHFRLQGRYTSPSRHHSHVEKGVRSEHWKGQTPTQQFEANLRLSGRVGPDLPHGGQ